MRRSEGKREERKFFNMTHNSAGSKVLSGCFFIENYDLVSGEKLAELERLCEHDKSFSN